MRPTRRQALAAGAVALAGGYGVSGLRPTRDEGPPPDGDARVGLVGDLMLGRSVHERHHDAPADAVWGSTLGHLRELDGLVANLECCVSTRGERWPDKVYYFRGGPAWALPALERAGTVAVSLANNHALDFGAVALRDTLDGLAESGIAAVGAGEDRGSAVDPATVEVGGVTLGLLGLTDRMPAFTARPDRPGTAVTPLTARNVRTRRLVRRQLRRLRDAGAELVVASLHWGPNWETVKRPPYREFARWLVDAGVDVVHGHSAHVVQGVEVYRNRPILYDCGDFVDDYVVKPDLHNDRSFLFELVVEDGVPAAVRLVPVEIRRSTVHLADGEAARWLRGRMRSLSARFGTRFRDESGTPALRLSLPVD
jgi:poly-gamma-glutamate synthesis protein (capsule biosynthesis protein)